MTDYYMTDVVLDCETLSVAPNAAIIQLAAVPVCRGETQAISSPDMWFNEFIKYHGRDPRFDADLETIQWWSRQPNWASMRLKITNEGLPAEQVAHSFVDWFRCIAARNGPSYPVRVWGYGAVQDVVWVENLLRACGAPIPWGYRETRCLRTYLAEFPETHRATPTEAHNGLSDAIAQAQTLLNIDKIRNPK